MTVHLLYLSVSLLIGGSAYLITQHLIMSVVIMFGFILYFEIAFNPFRRRNTFISTRYSECYQFINAFIIAFSIKGTLSGSLESCQAQQPDSVKEAIEKINHINIEERLEYLGKYFPFYVYDLFLNIINLSQEQGGNILDTSKHLLREIRQIEEQKDRIFKASIRKLGEIIILWGLSIVILILVRFSLNQFYNLIVNNLFFRIGIGIFYAFMLISLYFSLKQIFKTTVKGVKEFEKIKKTKHKH